MSPDLPAALPTSMIEAAAEALSVRMTGFFHFNGEDVREVYREHARAVLAAALAECEVREEVGNRLWIDGAEDKPWDDWSGRELAERRVAAHAAARAANPPPEDVTARRWHGNAALIRRLVITTPASPVDTPREEPK